MAKPDKTPPRWAVVQRDQCNGVTLACVNCQAPLGDRHHTMCYAAAIARKAAHSGRSDGGESRD